MPTEVDLGSVQQVTFTRLSTILVLMFIKQTVIKY